MLRGLKILTSVSNEAPVSSNIRQFVIDRTVEHAARCWPEALHERCLSPDLPKYAGIFIKVGL